METPIQHLIKWLDNQIDKYASFNYGKMDVTAILTKQKCEELLTHEINLIKQYDEEIKKLKNQISILSKTIIDLSSNKKKI